jgi:hypothetical protein
VTSPGPPDVDVEPTAGQEVDTKSSWTQAHRHGGRTRLGAFGRLRDRRSRSHPGLDRGCVHREEIVLRRSRLGRRRRRSRDPLPTLASHYHGNLWAGLRRPGVAHRPQPGPLKQLAGRDTVPTEYGARTRPTQKLWLDRQAAKGH